jgi:glycosyltransferase involved in cell wall biosynthesis
MSSKRRRRLRGVAIVVHNIDAVGGMERQALRLAERLSARGVHVTIVTTYTEPRFTIPLRPQRKWYERRGRIEIVRVPMYGGWMQDTIHQLIDVAGTYALMRRRRKIDVIYGVQYTGAFHAAHIAEATGMPTAVKFACGGEHGDFHVLALQENALDLRDALGRMDRYVIISEEIRQEAAANGLDAGRFVKIRNGVDTKRFNREGPAAALPELGSAPERQVVFFAGRHDTQKRVDVLVRAFAKVVAQVPGARLACAGSGPRVEEYRSLARELGVADRVAFLGARPDVEALHRAAQVFVLPSAAEGLPNALLEALAAGTPSVATAIPGTTDVVEHEKEALLVPLDDVDALAAAIVRLLRDRALAERLAQAGLERIRREFDMERVTDQYVALFEALAATATEPASYREFVLAQRRLVRTAGRVARSVGRVMIAVWIVEMTAAITRFVVATKGVFGIEGDILRRRGAAPPAS